MTTSNRITLLPADGDWASKEWFRTTAFELAPREVVESILVVLQSIFTVDWARNMHQEELANGPSHVPHPFVWHFIQRGGVRALLELGLALAFLGVPSELAHDLTRPERYRSRSREIIAAAFFKYCEAELRFLPEERGAKRPEFIASLDGREIGVEVKGLDYGEAEKRHDRLQMKLFQATADGFRATSSVKESVVDFELADEVLEHVVSDDDGRAATEIGRALGIAWARLVDAGAEPGRHPGPPGVTVRLRPPHPNSGLQHSMNAGSPPARKYWERMRRRLKKAGPKFVESGFPGIVVFEPPMRQGVWPSEVLRSLISALDTDASWATEIAAVILTESIPFIDREDELERGSDLRIIRGRKWDELPTAFQQRWSSRCNQCGCVHDHFDLLTFVNRAAAGNLVPDPSS